MLDWLKSGDTLGLIAPCNATAREKLAPVIQGLRALGFQVKESANLYSDTYGYSASEQERADDLHRMLEDEEVRMILFGGGNVGNEFLPLLDFDRFSRNPKWILSYSNGTTLLNALHANTGRIVHYGFPGAFANLSEYDRKDFFAHFIEGGARYLPKSGAWETICGGVCEGALIGGYTECVAMITGSRYVPINKSKRYILFLENHEKFDTVGEVAGHIAHIEQSEWMPHIGGLLFGHYSIQPNEWLSGCLRRFGERNRIPVLKCDEFGHGDRHAILPIGGNARLDAERQIVEFL